MLALEKAILKKLESISEMICGDFTNPDTFKILKQKYFEKQCEFLIATPPCQGMSSAGKRNNFDKRNSLIINTIDFIKTTKPKYILIENVPQILKTTIIYNNTNILIPEFIKQELEPLGYQIKYQILDSADYYTPQHRKRAIFIITNQNKKLCFPPPQPHINVEEAIGTLPSLEAGQSSAIAYHYAKKHNQNHILWMQNTPTGKSALDNHIFYPQKNNRKIKGFKTTYKRMQWDKPAPTITMANGSISSQNNVHPGRKINNGTYSDARVLTLLELFILSGLPSNYAPPKWASDNLVRQVLGESFPPKFAKEIVKELIK
jgi:DNA (cytosine-5)-methyltransferase 1